MLRRHRSCVVVLFTVALTTALTACATPGPGSLEPDGPRSADTPMVSRSDLVVPTSRTPQPTTTTLIGHVEEGVEAGCTVLRTDDGGTFTLGGSIDGLRGSAGPVTVRGRLDPDLMSYCMQGPVFVVEGANAS